MSVTKNVVSNSTFDSLSKNIQLVSAYIYLCVN